MGFVAELSFWKDLVRPGGPGVERIARPLSSDQVWMAPAWQGVWRSLASGRVRPCIRRLICGFPARPDERPREALVPINGPR